VLLSWHFLGCTVCRWMMCTCVQARALLFDHATVIKAVEWSSAVRNAMDSKALAHSLHEPCVPQQRGCVVVG